ncbi:MAG: hypothetical protein COV44_02625 [Deltaproteobacteria bacterium CG11_big_fil_rev_8_21_14_0_20_45_16]|nr:MAG: hypothetical protein COV44_02625 [Deltaproteobacteria bacterium CG11_big_fil_rev_8_21_14_0_20_45_16]
MGLAYALRHCAIVHQHKYLEGLAPNEIPEFQAPRTSFHWEVLNFQRGDHVLVIHKPPLKPTHWTVNYFSLNWIPWERGLERKKKPIGARSAFK